MKKEYQNGDTTVIWKPDLCYHSKNCVRNLPKVFDPQAKPWIQVDQATEEELRRAIDKCPSGALSYRVKGETEDPGPPTVIEVTKDGPVLVRGKLTLKSEGHAERLERDVIALCRCGASENKPYCDGSHRKIGFQGA
jgi:uncharacterized Fe-S cluster protein YjdI